MNNKLMVMCSVIIAGSSLFGASNSPVGNADLGAVLSSILRHWSNERPGRLSYHIDHLRGSFENLRREMTRDNSRNPTAAGFKYDVMVGNCDILIKYDDEVLHDEPAENEFEEPFNRVFPIVAYALAELSWRYLPFEQAEEIAIRLGLGEEDEDGQEDNNNA